MSEHLLQTVILVFFFLVIGSILLVAAQKQIRLLIERYRIRRQRLFHKPLMAFLCGDDSAFEILKTKRSIDRDIIVLALMECAENFGGEFQPRIRLASEQLGFVDSHLRHLKSRWWWVRAEAAYRLGLMRSSTAEPFLVKALDDPVPEVRLMAIRSLARLQGELALRPILEHFKDRSSWGLLEISDIALRLGPACVPILLETLTQQKSLAQWAAIDILGLMKDSRAVAPLIQLLDSPEEEVRIRVVKALGLIGHPDGVTAVCQHTLDPAWEVRLMICSAIWRARSLAHIQALVYFLNDAEKRVRVEAAEALIQLGEPGLVVLRQARLALDPFTRHLATQCLRPAAPSPLLPLV